MSDHHEVLPARPTILLRLMVLALVAANIFVLSSILSEGAAASHSFNNGDCWRAGTPTLCQAGYLTGQLYYWNVTTYWKPGSAIRSLAEPGFNNGRSVWTAATGPQYFYPSGTPRGTLYMVEWPYLNPACHPQCTQGSWGALTLNWKWNGSSYSMCYQSNGGACTIAFSEIYVNANWCSGSMTTTKYQYVFAHELGHVLGLNDHPSGSMLMNQTWSGCSPSTSATSPTSTEIGTSPPCSGTPGIRCIYNW
jgi:hypothetical protein